MKSRGRLFLFLILALGAGLWYLWPNLQNTVSVRNRSTRTIAHLTVTTDEASESFENIAPGEMRGTKVRLGQKTRFVIKGEFEDKTPIEKNVTFTNASNEPGQHVVLTVGVDGNIQVDVQAPKS
jgi:hypothetical protein